MPSEPLSRERIAACPFCGGEAELSKGPVSARVECSVCDAWGAVADDPSAAIAAWNRRTPQPAERHDCDTWRMEGIGCTDCNPTAQAIMRDAVERGMTLPCPNCGHGVVPAERPQRIERECGCVFEIDADETVAEAKLFTCIHHDGDDVE